MHKKTVLFFFLMSGELAAISDIDSVALAYYLDEYPLPPVGSISETSIKAQLSDVSQYHYDRLDKDGKALVFELIHQECRGKNRCRGFNACKNEELHQCAGFCSCKGQAIKPFEDSNLAVRVAAKYMAEKRMEINMRMK